MSQYLNDSMDNSGGEDERGFLVPPSCHRRCRPAHRVTIPIIISSNMSGTCPLTFYERVTLATLRTQQ